MPVRLDRQLISDSALAPLADKVEAGERLSFDDGVALFKSNDITGIGHLADSVNRAKHGDRVMFAANQHINPTNICILRKTCVFCSYARLPKEEGAYRYTMEQVWEEAATANSTLTREFHIVGGLDMKAGLAYYTEMFRGLKERHPHVHIKALTAVEIAHIARIEKMSVRDTLIALHEAGLDTMPGGGAEVFSPGVRATIADKKLSGEEYIAVHREAHSLGIRSNCTMLYGHVESYEDRVAHLAMLRDLQDETGGYLAYIPLAYHPDHNELGETLHRTGTATSGFDDLKNLAVGRLFLDNIDHIKSHWIMVTPFVSQVSLHFGVNDLEGTVVREKIYHEAGAHTAQAMTLDQILRLIRGAKKVPVERDSFYRVVRTFDDDPTAPAKPPTARSELTAA
ncbi:MAG TPA: aminofutalosine synthase MqnE [Gemmatimonadaceae bacterium]|jgi:aminodeoxyfutalosine synthase|nr:aminofutalosine synthase MqnE [Gemmatimonadaceae bacterium]